MRYIWYALKLIADVCSVIDTVNRLIKLILKLVPNKKTSQSCSSDQCDSQG